MVAGRLTVALIVEYDTIVTRSIAQPGPNIPHNLAFVPSAPSMYIYELGSSSASLSPVEVEAREAAGRKPESAT